MIRYFQHFNKYTKKTGMNQRSFSEALKKRLASKLAFILSRKLYFFEKKRTAFITLMYYL
jgi:hypothetical protein